MAKNKFFLTPTEFETIVNEFAELEDKNYVNNKKSPIRYTIIHKDIQFKLDLYIRKDKKITINAIGPKEEKESGEEFIKVIQENTRINEEMNVSFSIKIKENIYDDLIKYLNEEDSKFTLTDTQDKDTNGIITKYITEYGDKGTLTYYTSTGNMLYQGLMMDLYSEIRTFVLPEGNVIEDTSPTIDSEFNILNKKTNEYIDRKLEKFYTKTNSTSKMLIEDSVKMLLSNLTMNEYSAWTMPILRVLEIRIKGILDKNDCVLDTYESGDEKLYVDGEPVFKYLKNHGHVVNPAIGVENSHISTLEKCHDYLKQNRHGLFHGRQKAETTRILPTPESAKQIIDDVCGILEGSYLDLGF